jgi:hypothetical protein
MISSYRGSIAFRGGRTKVMTGVLNGEISRPPGAVAQISSRAQRAQWAFPGLHGWAGGGARSISPHRSTKPASSSRFDRCPIRRISSVDAHLSKSPHLAQVRTFSPVCENRTWCLECDVPKRMFLLGDTAATCSKCLGARPFDILRALNAAIETDFRRFLFSLGCLFNLNSFRSHRSADARSLEHRTKPSLRHRSVQDQPGNTEGKDDPFPSKSLLISK